METLGVQTAHELQSRLEQCVIACLSQSQKSTKSTGKPESFEASLIAAPESESPLGKLGDVTH